MGTGKRQAKRTFAVLLLILLLSMAYNSYGDAYPPLPDWGMIWADPPAATGPYTIVMTAVDACDVNDMPCQYLFTCTTNSNFSSAWQSSPTYEATGLTPKTKYTFNVQAKDNAGNTNTASYNVSATTDDNSTPPVLRLDLNNSSDNNEPNTQTAFLPFIIENSGSEINGVIIDLSGNITSARRDDPCGDMCEYQLGGLGNGSGDPCYYLGRGGERLYRDFIYGINPSGVAITLWGLGVNQDCNIMIWAYDAESLKSNDVNRVANWYANGTHILDTNFIGGAASRPRYLDYVGGSNDLYKFAFKGRATADSLGRIALTCTRGSSSPADQPFAFVNALKVEPNKAIAFVATKYAYRPQPASGVAQCVPVNAILKWKNGSGVLTHDLYLGTNSNDVNTASRASHPNVLVYKPDLTADQNQGVSPITNGFFALDTTYYWKVDENDSPTLYRGENWHFTTCPNSVVDNFDEYAPPAGITDLQKVWKAYDPDLDPTNCAEVYPAREPNRGGPPSWSMKYDFYNFSYPPYISEARASTANTTVFPARNGLGIDPNWLGMGAKALVLWFYGQAGNDATKPMYVKLTDGNNVTGKVAYDGDMNDIRQASWHEWNIDLQKFVDNNSVNLADVNEITIGFGDGTQAASDGTVFFEDIQLYTTRCVLAKRSADFAKVDYAPLDIYGHPGGDCKVDYQELEIMTEYWLDVWDPEWTPPSDYVAYWPMNEGDGNRIFTDPCNPLYTGTFSPSGVTWATPGETGRGGAHALYFDGSQGARVSCGNQNPAEPNGQITLAVWIKWLGPRNDPYLWDFSQGVIGKRDGWSDDTMMFMFEIAQGTGGTYALLSYPGGNVHTELYSPQGILNPYIGQWVHIAATFDGTTAKLYFNGGEVASGPFRFSTGTDTYLTIGNTMDINAWSDSPESFYGYLDEPRIYNRPLTADEIMYMAGREPPCELYSEGWEYPQVINFGDYGVLMNYWLLEDMFP